MVLFVINYRENLLLAVDLETKFSRATPKLPLFGVSLHSIMEQQRSKKVDLPIPSFLHRMFAFISTKGTTHTACFVDTLQQLKKRAYSAFPDRQLNLPRCVIYSNKVAFLIQY